MMQAVRLPPFEFFYLAHRDEVLAHLRRLVGSARAEDAFQETFLRALRGYPRLRHARHLRAWIMTIATRVAHDEFRHAARRRTSGESPESTTVDGRPAYAEVEHLTDELPPTERAAVVLRYAYDLPYAEIGAALGSTPEAARQAASAGVRRLRRKEKP
jgi:RNA polymerase sigma-70 factor (ECF subfamily)